MSDHDKVLHQLFVEGKITISDIERAREKILSHSRKVHVDTIHTLMCSSNHDTGECRYYDEEQLPNTWELTYHKLWLDFSSKPIKLIPESVREESTSTPDD